MNEFGLRPKRRRGRIAARDGARTGVLMLALALLAGCTEPARKQIRSWTYPPGYNYASTDQVRTAMRTIAAELTRLDRLLEPITPPVSAEVLSALQRMDEAIDELGSDGWPANHPRLRQSADTFREQVSVALLGLQEQPPAYHPARSLSDPCRVCHERN